jgi:hypothetical protein
MQARDAAALAVFEQMAGRFDPTAPLVGHQRGQPAVVRRVGIDKHHRATRSSGSTTGMCASLARMKAST